MALRILALCGVVSVCVGLFFILWPLALISAGGFALFFAYTEG